MDTADTGWHMLVGCGLNTETRSHSGWAWTFLSRLSTLFGVLDSSRRRFN